MWRKPWIYPEAASICGALLLTGILLQITVGKIDWALLAFPVNLILLTLYLIALTGMHFLSSRIYLFRWMSTYPAAISALIAVVSLTVVMGLVRQADAGQTFNGPEAWFGFSQMLSAWPFVLLFSWLMTLLGMTILHRLPTFNRKTWPFLLNHLGLFLAVIGAVAGSGDIQKLKMITGIGKTEWRAFDSEQNLVELPLALELTDFTIDEYPPKLLLISNQDGQALPSGKPDQLVLEENTRSGRLGDWQIQVERQIPEAGSVSTADTVKFVDYFSRGATYAAYIKVFNTRSKQQKEGWVSCGSFIFPYRALYLNEETSIIMPEREPRRFVSKIKVYTQSGKKQTATVEVNHPLEIEGWKIYQTSYDESKGKWSDVSIFELVRDPWLPVVYTGIFMLIAGALWMFITASQRKEVKS